MRGLEKMVMRERSEMVLLDLSDERDTEGLLRKYQYLCYSDRKGISIHLIFGRNSYSSF
jgi:hypothetical protein